MSHILFISDLHLSPRREDITGLFVNFLRSRAAQADALYMLGDLFEMWLGDDVSLADHPESVAALKALTDSGVRCYFLHGNRDFTVGNKFAQATGVTVLDDPSVIELDGQPVAISHGDHLCTDDVGYQRFRRVIRNRLVLGSLLRLPPAARRWIGAQLRSNSSTNQPKQSISTMDVTQPAVEKMMSELNVSKLIHGHTHLPNQHFFSLNGQPAERHVLGDWYTQGSVLSCDEGGWSLETMPFLK